MVIVCDAQAPVLGGERHFWRRYWLIMFSRESSWWRGILPALRNSMNPENGQRDTFQVWQKVSRNDRHGGRLIAVAE